MTKLVIVGGVAGGATAAARARRTNEQAEIVLFERGPYISFANCGLPYYVGREIGDRSALLLQTPESFNARFHVDVRVWQEVIAIDRAQKRVRVKKVKSGEEYDEPYGKLILAPGALPIVPPLPGINAPNIFTVRTVPDAVAIRQFVEERKSGRAVVVGAGYIGLEMVENLQHLGLTVTLVEKADQVLAPLDLEMAAFVQVALMEMGVEVVLGDGIADFVGSDPATAVRLESGRVLEADLFILGIGVRPDTRLAREAGLAIGETGGIIVDEQMRTSDPNIYAAGDAVEVKHLVTGKPSIIALAGPANKEGRVAGANAVGDQLTFPGAIGTAIVRVGETVAAATGLNEKTAQHLGLDFFTSYTMSGDHAEYYPGAQQMLIKIVVERPTGRLLGAQVVGGDGVDKRTDVFATAIAGGLTVDDLTHLDLAYAPPFGAAKDPAIVAGMVAQNVLRGQLEAVTPLALISMLEQREQREQGEQGEQGEQVQMVDVRDAYEYAVGSIPDAVNVPVDEMRSRLAELNPALTTVVYDGNGLKGYVAARILMQSGFGRVFNLTGGFTLWSAYQALRTVTEPVG